MCHRDLSQLRNFPFNRHTNEVQNWHRSLQPDKILWMSEWHFTDGSKMGNDGMVNHCILKETIWKRSVTNCFVGAVFSWCRNDFLIMLYKFTLHLCTGTQPAWWITATSSLSSPPASSSLLEWYSSATESSSGNSGRSDQWSRQVVAGFMWLETCGCYRKHITCMIYAFQS